MLNFCITERQLLEVCTSAGSCFEQYSQFVSFSET